MIKLRVAQKDAYRTQSKGIALIFLALLVLASTLVSFDNAQGVVVATVPVGGQPSGVAYDSAKGEVLEVNGGLSTVSVISDTSDAVVANISVGESPCWRSI